MAPPSRYFVPWLSDDATVPAALTLLEAPIAARVRPRLRASTPVLAALRRALPDTIVYVDAEPGGGVHEPITTVPIVAVDDSIDRIVDCASRYRHLAVNVPVHYFERGHDLSARLSVFASALPECVPVDLFVDVPTRDSLRVAETIAAGAAQRIPNEDRWTDVVITFVSDGAPSRGARELRRPQYRRWARNVSRCVTPGESVDLPANAFVYPLDDRWIVTDATRESSGRLLAELIAGNTGFSERCCAGDRWISSASKGDVDADDAAAWRQAALVHWLTTAVTAADAALGVRM